MTIHERTMHANEIESTRMGGFGSSDARMIYKIGLKGLESLSNTDKKRIAVAKGLQAYQAIQKTDAMQRGHDFEDWYAIQPFAPIGREAYLEKPIAANFKTFAHADFCEPDDMEVWELKCVQHPDTARDYNQYQLQWYYMLGVTRVWLVVCDSALPFHEGTSMPLIIDPDRSVINTMIAGIELLDGAWDTIDLTTGDDWDVTDLLPFEASDVVALTNYLTEIKVLEQQAEERREKVLQFMQDNGIKSLKSDYYSITYVPESTAATFDKKKLLKDHPEIKEADYLKISEKKAYIKVTIK